MAGGRVWSWAAGRVLLGPERASERAGFPAWNLVRAGRAARAAGGKLFRVAPRAAACKQRAGRAAGVRGPRAGLSPRAGRVAEPGPRPESAAGAAGDGQEAARPGEHLPAAVQPACLAAGAGRGRGGQGCQHPRAPSSPGQRRFRCFCFLYFFLNFILEAALTCKGVMGAGRVSLIPGLLMCMEQEAGGLQVQLTCHVK